jgi:O-antigen/teichoic acid export membrane protein
MLSRKIGTFSWRIDTAFIKQLLKVVFPFTLIAVIAIINLRIDTIMLSLMLDDKAVGLYSVAVNLLTAVMFVPSYFSVSLSPLLNRFFKTDVRKLIVMFKSVFWLMLLLGAAGGLVLFFVSKPVLVILFGAEYVLSVPVLQILSMSFFLSFVLFIAGSVCMVIDRQKFYAAVIAVSVLINIVLNYLFIKSMGMSGAAVSTVIAQLFQIVVILFFLKRRGFFFVAPVPKEAKLR